MKMSSSSLPALAVGSHDGWLRLGYTLEPGPFTVPLAALSDPSQESWALDTSSSGFGPWAVARRGEHTLICASFDGEEIGALTRRAYEQMLAAASDAGTPNLVRIWNYVRDINGVEEGLERYQRFSVGRFEALAEAGYELGSDLPAASAVGSRQGPQLTIAALASTRRGVQVENPRQVSAWAYPVRYGPRSPSFSRATIESTETESRLWISGTASIVGHQSVHPDDPAAQMNETLANLEAVIGAAGMDGGLRRLAMLKVYVRHKEHFALFEKMLSRSIPGVPVIWLEADICRAELLLEIEALAT